MENEEQQITTIRISQKLREQLEKIKIHPRQPLEEVLEKLLKYNNNHNQEKKKIEEKKDGV